MYVTGYVTGTIQNTEMFIRRLLNPKTVIVSYICLV